MVQTLVKYTRRAIIKNHPSTDPYTLALPGSVKVTPANRPLKPWTAPAPGLPVLSFLGRTHDGTEFDTVGDCP